MSYVPYDPDVYPPEPVADAAHRPRRSWKWPIGILLYLLGVCGWVVWMKLPPKIMPPLAKVALGSGTELRLIHIHAGQTPGIEYEETFGRRIRMEPVTSVPSYEVQRRGLWLVLTAFDPGKESFGRAGISGARILEPGSPYPLKATLIQDSNALYTIVYFPVVPWRLPVFRLELSAGRNVVEMTIPNPEIGGSQQTTDIAKELPQKVPIRGGALILDGIAVGSSKDANFPTPEWWAMPRFRFDVPGLPESAFTIVHVWSDSTGNVARSGILPFSEPVWRLEAEVQQTSAFPFEGDQIDPLGKFVVPAPGQIQMIKVPPRAAKQGISDIVVLGQGQYLAGGRTSRHQAAAQIPLKGPTSRTYWSVTEWSVYQFAYGKPAGKGTPLLRLRKAGQVLTPSGSGSTESGPSREVHFSAFRDSSGTALQFGEEVTVEMVYPESETLSFRVARPPVERFSAAATEAGRKK